MEEFGGASGACEILLKNFGCLPCASLHLASIFSAHAHRVSIIMP